MTQGFSLPAILGPAPDPEPVAAKQALLAIACRPILARTIARRLQLVPLPNRANRLAAIMRDIAENME